MKRIPIRNSCAPCSYRQYAMDFLKKLRELFPGEGNFSEDRLTVRYSVSIKASQFPPLENVSAFLSNLPKRDNITINLSTEGEDFFHFSNYEDFSLEKWIEYYDTAIDAEYCFSIQLIIDKRIDNSHCTVYSYFHFINNLAKLSLTELIRFFAIILKTTNGITFDILEDGYCWGTEHVVFLSEGSLIDIGKNRLMTLKACRDNAHFLNFSTYDLLPSDFHIVTDYSNNPLTESFRKLETLLSLLYLSNFSSLNEKGCIISFTSLRDIKEEILFTRLHYNEEWYKIFAWSYADDHASDKLALVRNIVSLNCRYRDILDIDTSILASIQSNYMIYLKSNVSQYLEARNKAGGYISSVILQISEHIDKLSMNFIHNIVTIFAFMLSVVLPKLITESSDICFTDSTRSVLFFILIGSFAYLVLCCNNFNDRITNVKESFSLLKENYTPIFSAIELDEIFNEDKLLKRIHKVKIRRNWIVWLWVLAIIACGIFIDSVSISPWMTSLYHFLQSVIYSISFCY